MPQEILSMQKNYWEIITDKSSVTYDNKVHLREKILNHHSFIYYIYIIFDMSAF